MHHLDRFRVTGISKLTRATAHLELEAPSEAAARDKAELQNIAVTCVERLTPQSVSYAAGGVAAGNRVSTSDPPRRWRTFIVTAIWWVAFVSALLVGVAQWSSQFRSRYLSLEVLLEARGWQEVLIGLEATVASNMYGVVAAAMGVAIFYLSKRTTGRVLIVLSLATIAINLAGQYRGIGERRSERGFEVLSAPQGKQAPKEHSQSGKSAGEPRGEAAAVGRNSIASKAAQGDVSEFAKVAEEALNGVAADASEYQRGLQSLGFESILLPKRLDSASEVNASLERVAAARQLLNTFDLAVRARLKKAQEGFAAANQSIDREATMAQFDALMESTRAQLEKSVSYEFEICEEVELILRFMLTPEGKFVLVGDRLQFSDDSYAGAYQSSRARIQAIAAKQQAVQEAMQESAREMARRANEGAGAAKFEPASVRSTSTSAARTRVDLDAEGPSINGKRIKFPMVLGELAAVLGPPSRSVAMANTVHVWDDLGISCTTETGRQEVDLLVITINKQVEENSAPKRVCEGPIMLGGVEVRDIDTPRSLNRRLKEIAFKSDDVWGDDWELRFPTYAVSMSSEAGGLSDALVVRAVKAP